MTPWKRLHSTTLVDDRWMRLAADRCRLPDGQEIEPYYVIHEKDWVHVFAVRPDGRLLIVRQYRHAAGVTCAELPGGVIDAGESPLVAARRELLEETGHASDHWTFIGRMYANPARQTNSVHIYLARGAVEVAAQRLDASEDIEVSAVDMAEVGALIDSGEFSQALHIASYHRARIAFTAAG